MCDKPSQLSSKLFQDIEEGSVITLLTPLIQLSSELPNQELSNDPFESLGRKIAESHFRVRHVPYTKEDGLTTTHIPFITRASAVILVCDSPEGRLKRIKEIEHFAIEQSIVIVVLYPRTSVPNLSSHIPSFYIYSYCEDELKAIALVLFGQGN